MVSMYALDIRAGGNPWKTGDWLIHYETGWVRRGLMGSVLLALSDMGLPLLWLTFAVQTGVLVGLFAIVVHLYRMVPREREWWLVLLNPAFLLFPFFSIEGGYRKEMLVLLALACMALGHARGRMGPWHVAAGLLLYGVAVFSHEGMAFSLPFFLWLIWRGQHLGSLRREHAIAASLAWVLISALALWVAQRHPGHADTAAGVCEAITARGVPDRVCGGAIDWLGRDVEHVRAKVQAALRDNLLTYLPLVLLSLLPWALLRPQVRSHRVWLGLGVLAFLPLYVLAEDWGRWTHTWVSLGFIVLLADTVRVPMNFVRVPLPWLLLYLCTWSMPHCCLGRPRLGWLEWLQRVAHTLNLV